MPARIRVVYPQGGPNSPIVNTATLPNGAVGVPYSQSLSASNGVLPLVWTLISSTSGWEILDPNTGLVHGTPTVVQPAEVLRVQVKDALGRSGFGSVTFGVVSNTQITSTSPLPSGTVGQTYSFTFSAAGGTAPYSWALVSGTLPPGLSLSSSGGLNGIPTTAGTSTFTVVATDVNSAPSPPTQFSVTMAVAGAFDFYIGPNAPPTNIGPINGGVGGTQANPWNIAAINDGPSRAMYSGKKVGWLDGIYNVNAIVSAAAGNIAAPVYSIEGGPDAAHPTVMQSVNQFGAKILGWLNNDGVTYPTAGAFILGQSIAQRSGQPAIQHLGNVVIDGFYMAGGVGGFIIWDGGTTTPPPQPFLTGLVVQNCETFSLSAVGSTGQNLGHYKTQGTSGAIVRNCRMHGINGNGLATPANSSLIFSFVCQNNLYEHNTLYDACTLIHDKNPNVNNSLIQYNYMELNSDATNPNTAPTSCLEDCTGGINGTNTVVQNNIMVIPASQGTANAKFWFGFDFQNGFGGNFLPDSCQSIITFINNTCVTTGQSNLAIQCLGDVAGAVSAKQHQYNNIIVTTGANIVSTVNGVVGQCDGPGCQGIQDYNIWSCTNPTTMSIASTRTAAGFNEGQVSTGYTVAQWKAHVPGIEANSIFATIAPSALFVAPNIALNPDGYKLLAGSQASGTGRVGGVSTGAPCDMGAWGGPNPPTQIGCNLPPVRFLANSMQGITLGTAAGGTPNWEQPFQGTDTKYLDTLPVYPSSPWGGKAAFTDQIQIISGQSAPNIDIPQVIVTDNTVPAGVSNQVMQLTLSQPYGFGGQPTQNAWQVQPSTTTPQGTPPGMWYQSMWIWMQADLTSRGNFQMEIAEWKTPDGVTNANNVGNTLGPERFQLQIMQESFAFGSTIPNFFITHNTAYGYPNGGFLSYSNSYVTPISTSGNLGYTGGITYGSASNPVPVPLGRWFKVEFAWNRSDQSGQGWCWFALTDPGSADPNLKAGIQIFAARGAYSFTDPSTNTTWTNGMNPGAATTVGGIAYAAATPIVNRIYVSTLGYGPIARTPSGTPGPYVIKYTDVQCYPGWPSNATAHPLTYR